MKKEFNKLMNVFNSIYRQVGKKRPSKRWKKKRFNKIVTPQEKRNVQHYGVGRTFATIDETLYVTAETGIGARNIINIAVTSDEFLRYKLDYTYFKILNIKITISSNIIGSGSNGFNYIKMNWDSASTEEEPQLPKDDNAKIFSNYRTKNIVFTFVPPNATINFDGYAYNYFDFMLTRDSTNLRSTLWYTRSVPYEMKISINMLFVGAQTRTAVSRVTHMINNLSIDDKNKIRKMLNTDDKQEDNKSFEQ